MPVTIWQGTESSAWKHLCGTPYFKIRTTIIPHWGPDQRNTGQPYRRKSNLLGRSRCRFTYFWSSFTTAVDFWQFHVMPVAARLWKCFRNSIDRQCFFAQTVLLQERFCIRTWGPHFYLHDLAVPFPTVSDTPQVRPWQGHSALQSIEPAASLEVKTRSIVWHTITGRTSVKGNGLHYIKRIHNSSTSSIHIVQRLHRSAASELAVTTALQSVPAPTGVPHIMLKWQAIGWFLWWKKTNDVPIIAVSYQCSVHQQLIQKKRVVVINAEAHQQLLVDIYEEKNHPEKMGLINENLDIPKSVILVGRAHIVHK